MEKDPNSYDPDAKMGDKIIFALRELGSGFFQDVVDVIVKNEPDIDKSSITRTIPVRLSEMYRSGKIMARRIGRRYEYSLRE